MAEHLNTADSMASGLRALTGENKAFASTQAAWRFYQNKRVSYQQLAQPLIEYGLEALKDNNADYVLVTHDWSHLDYTDHQSKQDRILLHNQKVFGYTLQTALLINTQTGEPLSVLCQTF